MDVLMKELFGSDIGLLSLFTIVFLISMGLFLWAKLASISRDENS